MFCLIVPNQLWYQSNDPLTWAWLWLTRRGFRVSPLGGPKHFQLFLEPTRPRFQTSWMFNVSRLQATDWPKSNVSHGSVSFTRLKHNIFLKLHKYHIHFCYLLKKHAYKVHYNGNTYTSAVVLWWGADICAFWLTEFRSKPSGLHLQALPAGGRWPRLGHSCSGRGRRGFNFIVWWWVPASKDMTPRSNQGSTQILGKLKIV